jgi:flagellar protein FliS
MSSRAASAYRRVYLDSAGPAQILDGLYRALLEDLADAQRAIDGRDLSAKARAVGHAHAIVLALQAALDPAAAPDVTANLARLYDWMIERLSRASVHLEVAPLSEVRGVAADLRAAFAAAATA